MRRKRRYHNEDIAPDEIFMDDRNIPEFDVHQFEGRIETPIKKRTIIFWGSFFLLIGLVFLFRAGVLQIREGGAYAQKSEQNRLEHQWIFPERGIIYDRNGVELAWNVPSTEDLGFSLRHYINKPGFGHILGFLHYPARDKSGVYYREDYEATAGVEQYYNDVLKGQKGKRIIETDAMGNVLSGNVIDPPAPGGDLHLSIDARVQSKFNDIIAQVSREEGYRGGAGAIMDVNSGELLALVSYPDFDSNIMTDGEDRKTIVAYNKDTEGHPFLNRVVSGVYTPGSIVKPIFALGALEEGVITPDTKILSIGYILVPNPYFPGKNSRFNDWRPQGWLDVRGALEWSSDVFFYEIAGGFNDQKGIGIRNLEKYARMFGFATTTGIDLSGEAIGTFPNPEWKEKNFPGDDWRVGDTYFTGIGQYGMQITPIQALREAGILASKGDIVTPHLVEGANVTPPRHVPINEAYFNVIQEGMRKVVLDGTGSVLNIPGVKIAAKTGTAELGVSKANVNSWVIGFFPYEKPRYAFVVLMDHGIKGNTTNASYVARQLFTWMTQETPEYLQNKGE